MDITAASPLGLASDCALATGAFTSDGNATSVVIGNNPRYIKVVNVTAGAVYEKLQGFPANTTLKNGAVDTSSAVLFPADTGLNEGGNGMLISAAACATGDLVAWMAFG